MLSVLVLMPQFIWAQDETAADAEEGWPDPAELLGEDEEGDDEWEDDWAGDTEDEVDAPQQADLGADDIDDLFSDPSAGIIEDDPQSEPDAVDVAAITTDPTPRFSGRVRTRGGVNVGVREWEDTPGELRDVLGGSGLFDTEAILRLDYRPTSFQRFFGSLKTSMDESTMTFSSPAVDELFVDYTLRENYFFRAGRQSLTWGQARLLGNPANFTSNINSGIALRSVAPLGPFGATGVIYSTRAYRTDADGNTGVRAFAYAGLLEYAGQRNSLGVSSYYRYFRDPSLRSAAYFKTTLSGIDFAFEGVTDWDLEAARESNNADDLDPEYQFIANALWESWFLPRLRVITEYRYDGSVESPESNGHRGGVALRLQELSWTSWTLNLRWLHAFGDESGQLVFGASGDIAPRISASAGIPWNYGEQESYYGGDDEDIPGEFYLSGLFVLSMTISF